MVGGDWFAWKYFNGGLRSVRVGEITGVRNNIPRGAYASKPRSPMRGFSRQIDQYETTSLYPAT